MPETAWPLGPAALFLTFKIAGAAFGIGHGWVTMLATDRIVWRGTQHWRNTVSWTSLIARLKIRCTAPCTNHDTGSRFLHFIFNLLIWFSIIQSINWEFTVSQCTFKSRDRSVGVALGYGLDEQGSRVRFPVEAGNFSLHHRVQNGSGAYPASYPMGAWGSFPGGKADHPPPCSAEVREWVELYLHSSNTPSRRCGSVKKAQGQLYIYLYIFIASRQLICKVT
jgi:hypothetical protein